MRTGSYPPDSNEYDKNILNDNYEITAQACKVEVGVEVEVEVGKQVQEQSGIVGTGLSHRLH